MRIAVEELNITPYKRDIQGKKIEIRVLQKRPDFLLVSSGKRQSATGFLLQARNRSDDNPLVRIGFTASKKIGDAVARNRAKRRLRALMRLVFPIQAQSGWDYVLVARPAYTIARDFSDLQRDLEHALKKLHGLDS